jgi:hypothetical protein
MNTQSRRVILALAALLGLYVAGVIARTAVPARIAGLGWTTFGLLYFGYHVTHLEGSLTDKAGNVVSLGASAILGMLLFPARTPVTGRGQG